jgi:hypothetical protein
MNHGKLAVGGSQRPDRLARRQSFTAPPPSIRWMVLVSV